MISSSRFSMTRWPVKYAALFWLSPSRVQSPGSGAVGGANGSKGTIESEVLELARALARGLARAHHRKTAKKDGAKEI